MQAAPSEEGAEATPPQVKRFDMQTNTKRLYRNLKHREVRFAPIWPTAGEQIHDAQYGADVDGFDQPKVIYLCGRGPADWLTWAADNLGPGIEPGAHYLDGNGVVLRYSTPRGPVEIHEAASWFGEEVYATLAAKAAYEALQALIAKAFDGGTILATPATTGRELFLRGIPRGVEYPVLDAETQDLIRATDGQGRIEVVPFAHRGDEWGGIDLPSLYEYDARFAYASMCWELPAGRVHRDDVNAFEGAMRGRYLVHGFVPTDWAQPFGLIGVKDEGGGWRYPHEPGEPFHTWADGAEVDLAIKHGWRFTVCERLLFPEPGRPLDTWAKKLTQLRANLDREGYNDHTAPVAALVRAALRNILLQSIGAFHGRPHVETHMLPLDRAQEVPANARRPRRGGPGNEWIIYGLETGQGWANLAHPEWSACIWGRGRARLLSAPKSQGALNRSPGTHVVGFRTDAIYLTGPQPEWDAADDGQPGRYRLKASSTTRAAWPRNGRELLALKAGMS